MNIVEWSASGLGTGPEPGIGTDPAPGTCPDPAPGIGADPAPDTCPDPGLDPGLAPGITFCLVHHQHVDHLEIHCYYRWNHRTF